MATASLLEQPPAVSHVVTVSSFLKKEAALPQREGPLLVPAHAISVNCCWARHCIQVMRAVGQCWHPLVVPLRLLFSGEWDCVNLQALNTTATIIKNSTINYELLPNDSWTENSYSTLPPLKSILQLTAIHRTWIQVYHYKYEVHIWISCLYLQRDCWEMRHLQQKVRAESVLQNICYSWNEVIAKWAVSSNTNVFLPVIRGQQPNPYNLEIFICPTLQISANTDLQAPPASCPFRGLYDFYWDRTVLPVHADTFQQLHGPHQHWLPEVGGRFCADRHCLVFLIISIQDLFHFRGL